jgi:hypothetical protein
MSGERDRGCTCPSARCEEGAVLLGIVGGDGLVAYVRPQLEIDEDFVQEAKKGRSAERRFRFASACVEGACAQWTGSRCSIIEMALTEQEAGRVPRLTGSLPHCSIRSNCRWFEQVGPRACGVCPLVITDATGEPRTETTAACTEGPLGPVPEMDSVLP